jgi:hypothetical protein
LKNLVLLFKLLLLQVVLASCSVWLPVTLFNNTGGAIVINTGSNVATVAPDQFFKFRYPSGSGNWIVRLTSGGCVYLYDIPDFPYKYGWPVVLLSSDRKGQVQVEKDFSINLLPPFYAGDKPAAAEMFLKREGFPLKPVGRKCQ